VAGVGDSGYNLYSSWIIENHSLRELAHFQLSAHFLNLCGLFFELRGQNSHSFFLLSYGPFQFLHFAVLFEEFVKQHRVHRVVAYGVYFAVRTASYQIRAYLFYILGNQPESTRTGWFYLRLVAETHWPEPINYLAGLFYWLDLVLKTP